MVDKEQELELKAKYVVQDRRTSRYLKNDDTFSCKSPLARDVKLFDTEALALVGRDVSAVWTYRVPVRVPSE